MVLVANCGWDQEILRSQLAKTSTLPLF